MASDVRSYFELQVIPLIAESHPRLQPNMSILVCGSFGLGLADASSDLDAVIYLEDEAWQEEGGQLQLLLEHAPLTFARTTGHPEICVHPASWLLGGHHLAFLEPDKSPPWEEVAIEDLFEMQHNLIAYDGSGLLHRLRQATGVDRFPGWLWRKRMMTTLGKLQDDDLSELESTVQRGRHVEATIILGQVLEDLLKLGFHVHRRYYPWRKHWRWAFAELPDPCPAVLNEIETVVDGIEWSDRLRAVQMAAGRYVEHIRSHRLLPDDVLDYPVWAMRCEAWSNPGWRNWVTRCERAASDAGYGPDELWIWSLWGWVNRGTPADIVQTQAEFEPRTGE